MALARRSWIGGVPLACFALLLVALPSPVLAVGGADARGCYGYSDTVAPLDANAPSFSFVDISATGTALPLGDDDVSAPIPIGFTFNFYGQAFLAVSVAANGFLGFTPPSVDG